MPRPTFKTSARPSTTDPTARTVRRHFVFGWSALCLYLTLGLVLELMHGLKLPYYLDVRHETRRLMWTLAHAHGTLFALVQIAFGVTLHHFPLEPRWATWISACLLSGLFLMPLGFFLGGIWLHAGDPGVGILLAPVGGVLLILGVGTLTIQLARNRTAKREQFDADNRAQDARKKR